MNRYLALGLARLAARRAGTGPGRLGRWALGRLERGGAAVDRAALDRAALDGAALDGAALDAVWRVWFDTGSAPLGDLLVRWQRPATGAAYPASLIALGQTSTVDPTGHAAALVAAAARTDHPIGTAARQAVLAGPDPALVDAVCAAAAADPAGPLAAFCVEHRLVPADPVRRAEFLVHTRQVEQFDAADPDRTLIAAAYAAAAADRRRLIRAALIETGHLDLLRSLTHSAAGRPGTGAEIGPLAEEAAARADWAELWRLVRDGSLVRALDLVGRFPGGWRPDDASRPLFDALAAASPRLVTATRATVVERGTLPLPGRYCRLAFAPDGSHLAVHSQPMFGSTPAPALAAYGLPDLGRLWQHDLPAESGFTVLAHAGGGVVGTEARPVLRLVRWAGGGRVEVRGGRAALRGGNRLLDPNSLPAGFVARSGGDLVLGSAGGREIRLVPWADLGLGPGPDGWREIASDPASGRFAVAASGLVLADAGARVLARGPRPGSGRARIALVGADRLVTAVDAGLRLWRPDGDRLELVASEQTHDHADRLAPFPGLDLVAVRRVGQTTLGDAWYLADGLARVPRPTGLPTDDVVSSPDGRWLAATEAGGIRLFGVDSPIWLDGLVRRPAVEHQPPDLPRVRGAEAHAVQQPVRALLHLLRLGLELRFGADVGLGAVGGPVESDIAVSTPDESGAGR